MKLGEKFQIDPDFETHTFTFTFVCSMSPVSAGGCRQVVTVPTARPSTLPGSTKQLLMKKDSIYSCPTHLDRPSEVPNILPIAQRAPSLPPTAANGTNAAAAATGNTNTNAAATGAAAATVAAINAAANAAQVQAMVQQQQQQQMQLREVCVIKYIDKYTTKEKDWAG